MAAPLFGLIRVTHCALRSAGGWFFCQGSDDYQRLRPEAFAQFVLGFSMPIAWPAVADGVAKGTTRNMAIRDRFPLTVATWLLMVVAVIVWNSGIEFFAYESIVGHMYVFARGLAASILRILRGRAGLRRQGRSGTVRGGGMAKPARNGTLPRNCAALFCGWFGRQPGFPPKTGVHRSA